MEPREAREIVPIEVNSVARQQAGAPVPTRMVQPTTPTDHDPSVGPTGGFLVALPGGAFALAVARPGES